MSQLDQCPSSKKEGLPVETPRLPRDRSAASGKTYWRSLDDLAQSKPFQDFLDREFPAYASELLDGTRRHFLKIMGASLALAGAATIPGCRRPDHKILAYNQDPETIVPGKPLYYATALPLPGGSCEGLLAETYEGRPTKLEGNPLHPVNLGRSTTRSQASIIEMYDPDRDPEVIAKFARDAGTTYSVTAWSEFEGFAGGHFGALKQAKGEGLYFLVEKATSPSRDRLRDRILNDFPRAKWFPYEPVDDEHALEGSRLAFGENFRQKLDLSKAKVIVSLDCDFLGGESSTLEAARGFADGRYRAGADATHAARDSSMSRIYVAESMMTLTGGQADHRLPLKPSRVGALALALAAEVLGSSGGGGAAKSAAAACAGPDINEEWVKACAEDLASAKGECVVLAGPGQPAAVHALAHAMNHALGAAGKTVTYIPVSGDASESSLAGIKGLAADIDAGKVKTLVVIGCNPVYDAPADLDLSEKYAKVPTTIHLGNPDETGRASKMHLARSHFLESWGDVESWEGTYSVVQPMIQPLYASNNELELLATILGDKITDPYQIVRATLAAAWKMPAPSTEGAADAAFEKSWRRTLHDGIAPNMRTRAASPRPDTGRIGGALSALAESSKSSMGVEVVFMPSPKLHDGRNANNGWLQEVPDSVTKVSWDNPLLISHATAKKLGLDTRRHPKTEQYNHGQVVRVTIGGRSLDIPILVQPGLAEDTVVMTLGYGRTVCGRIGNGVGFNAYAVRPSAGMRIARAATVEVVAGAKPALLAMTQDHWALEGRGILREVDLAAWKKYGDQDWESKQEVQRDPYDSSRDLNFAGLLGMESHTPTSRDIYLKRQQHNYTEVDANGIPKKENGRLLPLKGKFGRPYQQWGMSIDLTTCTGCAACTVACQAENNIPIVGKMEVAKGREMHWIRVDRYYGSDATSGEGFESDPNPDMVVQPMPCLHCENAPCEVVCPVNATIHDPEGLNNMAYNRCIGTKYCSNNCPYKVRRFNWFDYATKQFHGDYGQVGEPLAGKVPLPSNENFIPPRLREKILEVSTMQRNPRVTVRSSGVMEKCSFCIQRINAAKVEMKLNDLDRVPDGFIKVACQQACPTGAIVFGDIYDYDANGGKGSAVQQLRNDGRSYQLLGYLNTRPRTTHMLRLRNPNPRLRKPNEEPFHHSGSHDGHGHGDGHDHDHDHDHSHDEKHVMSLPVLGSSRGAGVPPVSPSSTSSSIVSRSISKAITGVLA